VELNKAPITADILTHQFIEDTQVRSVEDLFAGYAAGAARPWSMRPTPTNPSPATVQRGPVQSAWRRRGRGPSRWIRHGQMSTTNQNSTNVFDVERLDILHGSQGLLYGATGAGGIVNVVSKQANFNQTKFQIQDRIDQYGSHSDTFDGNVSKDWRRCARRDSRCQLDPASLHWRRDQWRLRSTRLQAAAAHDPAAHRRRDHNFRYIPITGSVQLCRHSVRVG